MRGGGAGVKHETMSGVCRRSRRGAVRLDSRGEARKRMKNQPQVEAYATLRVNPHPKTT